jgi:DNA-binding MarR family transcriptional regulator
MSDPSGDPPAFMVLNEIAIIEHLSRTAAERVLPAGLSMAGFTILNHMVRLGHDRRSPAQIASAMQVTRGATTGALKRLQAEGWIEVAPDERDGRAKVVRLTAAGRAVREASVAAMTPVIDDLLTRIDVADLEAILPTLRALRKVLDSARG